MKKMLMAAAVAAFVPAAAHASCATNSEMQAMNLHALKSSLMVAALSCGQQTEYNSFISKNQSLYSSDSQNVKGYFSRQYGGSAEYQMNRFITKLANEASNVSMKQESVAYCSAMKDSFKSIAAMDREGVKKHAGGAQYASLHGLHGCGTGEASAKLAMNNNATK